MLKKKCIGQSVLIILLVFVLIGCSDRKEDLLEDTFTNYFAYEIAIDAPGGFYYADSKGFLYFFDYAAEKEAIVCNKPNCKHGEWSETTPAEERCDAAVGGMSTGFTNGGKLYILQNDMAAQGNNVRLIASELDRSNQKEIADLNCQSVYSYALKGRTLYFVADILERVNHEDGSSTLSNIKKTVLYSVDLDNGAKKELFQKEGIGGVIGIMAAEKERMYLSYTYFKNEYDGTNFEKADQQTEYYVYSVETDTFERVFQDKQSEQIFSGKIIDGNLYVLTAPNDRSGKEEDKTVSSLKKISLDTGEEQTLAESTDQIYFFSEYAIYASTAGKSWFVYDFQQEKEISMPKIKMENVYLYYKAGEYIYGSKFHPEIGESVTGFFRLKDFMEGKEHFIEVHF